ncbi:antitoxin TumA [Desulfurivibrio dismutans]|uniref:antitoxin TumA n=1 Tax=Desulfurivibrio dismutans TaxID=1398908 RepID=UPI003D658E16
MRKDTVVYTSPLDALVAVTKRLSSYESQRNMDSEEFFNRYNRGELGDELDFVEWANDYRHYLELRRQLSNELKNAA